MAIDVTNIKSDIKTMLESLQSEKDPDKLDDITDQFADELSVIIKDAILSADVVSGIPVTTAVVGAVGTGTTTATGTLI